MVPPGLGDDQHPGGYEAALDPWLQQLWHNLRVRFPLPAGFAEVRCCMHLLHSASMPRLGSLCYMSPAIA